MQGTSGAAVVQTTICVIVIVHGRVHESKVSVANVPQITASRVSLYSIHQEDHRLRIGAVSTDRISTPAQETSVSVGTDGTYDTDTSPAL